MLSVQLAILGSYRLETLLEANDSESLERKKYHWLKRSNEKYWNILICKGVTALLVKKKKKNLFPDNGRGRFMYISIYEDERNNMNC